MKVLDLQCGLGHGFEGWFGSEADFVSQCERSLVQCPVCGDARITKKLSAPRLNLLAHTDTHPQPARSNSLETATPVHVATNAEVLQAWMEMSRRLIAETTDVGSEFAEEARKMHYGETEQRPIRGQTTPTEARSLLEEGIDVVPFLVPESLKNPLQ